MKICQITPGLISIPPNGWGAVEKIIWNYKLGLEKLGHTVDIKFPDEVRANDYDAIHVHVANQALMLAEKKIPYIFTMHDHHTYIWGVESFAYKQNQEAIEKSMFSLVPAEYLAKFFGHSYKTFYLPHGVDTDYFKGRLPKDGQSLLCVANNGFINNQAEDRKGFRYAIEAARLLDLPITIAGPKNNENFFSANKDLLDYGKLTVMYDLKEDALRDLYDNNSIFIHASSVEAGHPNLTILEAMAMGLPVVGTYNGSITLEGLVKAERSTPSVSEGIVSVKSNYGKYHSNALKSAAEFDYSIICKRLENIYKGRTYIAASPNSEDMKRELISFYETVDNRKQDLKVDVTPNVNINFIRGPFCEIRSYGSTGDEYVVQFIDPKTNAVVYESKILPNHWSRASREWFTPWKVKVFNKGNLILEHEYDAKAKRVYVHLDSKSLGDTIAWFPFVEEFRKEHGCIMICSTFWNDFFRKQYPLIEFVEPGTNVVDLYAMYTIGWFFNKDESIDYNKNVYDFRKDPLQKTASDILGLKYREIKPKITIPDDAYANAPKKKYVTMAMHSTAQCKYWNNSTGWQELVDHIKARGYDVWHISKEKGTYMGNTPPKGVIDKTGDSHINNRIKQLVNSELFIGTSSGLAWLAWAVGCKVIMISGTTDDYNEFDCIRIINKDVCHGCFNEHKFDPGDWNWCPLYKKTARQFECSKKIYASDVIKEVAKILIPITQTEVVEETKKKSKIAVLAVYDSGYKEICDISLKNFKSYCDKHGYDLIAKDVTNDRACPGKVMMWDRLKIMKDLLPNYEWMFYIDCDCLIMNQEKTVESIIDDQYNFVMTKIRFYEDSPFEGGALMSSAFLMKNDKMTYEYLDRCLTEDCPDKWDYEMRQMRLIFNKYPHFREKLKLVDEHILNSLWYSDTMQDGWNNASFIYEDGDFILHFCGRHMNDRAPLMRKFQDMLDDERNVDTLKIYSKREIPVALTNLGLIGNGIEIGVLQGDYSKILLDRWNGTLYMVDTWRPMDDYIDLNSKDDEFYYEKLATTIKQVKPYVERAHIMRMKSTVAADIFPDNYFDFIYIDANHNYNFVKEDLYAWYPKVKKGGMFSGDDYIPEDGDIWITNMADGKVLDYAGKFGVKKAVNEFAFSLGRIVHHTVSEPYWRQWYFIK